MIYGSVEGVKKWLPEVQGTVFDEELYNHLVSASIAAEISLKKVVDIDNMPMDLFNQISSIVEEWAAGYFRMVRQKGNRELVEDAEKKLEALISSLKGGVHVV